MPTERRRLIFSDDEIVKAVLSHCRNAGIALPDAEVEDFSVDLGDSGQLTLVFDVSSPSEADEITFELETVMCALIGLCRVRSIPLPRAASKRLEFMNGSLSLVFNMERGNGSIKMIAAA